MWRPGISTSPWSSALPGFARHRFGPGAPALQQCHRNNQATFYWVKLAGQTNSAISCCEVDWWAFGAIFFLLLGAECPFKVNPVRFQGWTFRAVAQDAINTGARSSAVSIGVLQGPNRRHHRWNSWITPAFCEFHALSSANAGDRENICGAESKNTTSYWIRMDVGWIYIYIDGYRWIWDDVRTCWTSWLILFNWIHSVYGVSEDHADSCADRPERCWSLSLVGLNSVCPAMGKSMAEVSGFQGLTLWTKPLFYFILYADLVWFGHWWISANQRSLGPMIWRVRCGRSPSSRELVRHLAMPPLGHVEAGSGKSFHHGQRLTIYPLVNSHNYGTSPFLMGKSTINGNFQ